MKLTENTKVRIRVPKHLYESIQAELGKMEDKEMEEAEKVNEYVGMSPDQMELMDSLGKLIIGGGLAGSALMAAKTLISFLKDKAADKAPSPESEPIAEELEEVLDFETLMEAVKDASKKKVEDKKKKEAEAKKKKAEDDKKKVEDKKKKEADAKKKAEAAKKK